MQNAEEAVNDDTAPILDRNNTVHKRQLAGRILAYKEAHNQSHVGFLKEVEEFVQKKLGNRTFKLGYSEASLRHFLSNHTKNAPNAQLMNFMYQLLSFKRYWDSDDAHRREVTLVADHHFHSAVEFLDIPKISVRNLRERAPGVYRVYRPIITHQGQFAIGLAIVTSDQDTGAVCYKEINRVKAKDGRQAKQVEFEGYLLRKSNLVHIFGRDTSRTATFFTMLSNCEIQDGKFNVMFGGFLDTLGSQVYTGRLFFERVADEMNPAEIEIQKDELDCFTLDQLPPSIQHFFRQQTDIGDVRLY
ncbi:MAG: hypothetical protein KDK08_28860 [Rhizobiaceae bacterium]|nr:hypothetical protein [Rhizobiaceae bacterium]